MGSHSVLLGRRARREWQSCHFGTDDVNGSLKSARPVREWRVSLVSLVSADAAVVAPWWKGARQTRRQSQILVSDDRNRSCKTGIYLWANERGRT